MESSKNFKYKVLTLSQAIDKIYSRKLVVVKLWEN